MNGRAPRHWDRRWACGALAVVLATAASALADSPCDPALPQPASNPYGYRLRGDRCEGVYVQEVGGSPLTVVSWTRSFPEFDASSRRPLQIEWDSLRGGSLIRLRAQSLRRRLYYRMDAIRSASSKSFTWPTDILSGLGIARPEAGVVGTAEISVAGSQREVYLPLRINQGFSTSRSTDAYALTLLPGMELKEIYLTLTGPEGSRSTKIEDGVALGYGYYPAERAVEIPVSGAKSQGLYHLEIGATLRSGGLAAVDFWFYHPGN